MRKLPIGTPIGKLHPLPSMSLRLAVAEVEERLVKKALEMSRQNESEAARQLGISRTTLRAKRRLYDLFARQVEQ